MQEGSFIGQDEYLAMRLGCIWGWADEALDAIWEGKEPEDEPLVELLERLAYNTRRAVEDIQGRK